MRRGIVANLKNASMPPSRSGQGVLAQAMPTKPNTNKANGMPPAKVASSCWISAGWRDGSVANSQRNIRKLAAVLDHGNEAMTAMARPSAIGTRRARMELLFIVRRYLANLVGET